MSSNKIEPLHKDVLAFRDRINKVSNKACSPMFKFNYFMDIILSLKELTEKENSLSRNDFNVIFALMNRAMREL